MRVISVECRKLVSKVRGISQMSIRKRSYQRFENIGYKFREGSIVSAILRDYRTKLKRRRRFMNLGKQIKIWKKLF